ncbi:MAG: Rieske (2Fe-2S) protein [Pirellulales bacterium]
MSRWVRIADVSDCPAGSTLECVAGDRVVALVHVGDQWHALDGVCPHQGGPLGKGSLEGTVLTCPWHGWQFDVCSGGNRISPSIVQPRFPVRVEDGGVWVDLS